MCAFRRYHAVVAELQVQVEKQRKELASMRAVGVGQFDRFGRVRNLIRCFMPVLRVVFMPVLRVVFMPLLKQCVVLGLTVLQARKPLILFTHADVERNASAIASLLEQHRAADPKLHQVAQSCFCASFSSCFFLHDRSCFSKTQMP